MGSSEKKYEHDVPISLDEAEKLLRSGILYLDIAEEDIGYYNPQSCDCSEIIIRTNEKLLLLKYEYIPEADEEDGDDEGGRFLFFTLDSYQQEYYNLRISSPDRFIQFDKFHRTNGIPIAIRFNYQTRFLYIFAFNVGFAVTKSVNELFWEMYENEEKIGNTIEEDDSVLFDCGLIKNGDYLKSILKSIAEMRE